MRSSLVKFTSILFLMLALAALLPERPASSATGYAQMTRLLRLDCAKKPNTLHLYQIGAAAVSGRPIWMVRVNAAPPEQSLRTGARVLVICRQHGDEPASTEAALQMIAGFASEPRASLAQALGTATLYIVPMANPDGAQRLTRENGAGADLNRDWGSFTQPETLAIYRAYRQIRPQVVLDLHSWTAADSFQGNSLEVGQQPYGVAGGVAATAALSLQSAAARAIHIGCGQTVTEFEYGAKSDLQLCHRFFAAREGAVAMLVETASGNDPAQSANRVLFDRTAVMSVLMAIDRNPQRWIAVARAENAVSAPDTAFTASAASLNANGTSPPPSALPATRPDSTKIVLRRAAAWAIGLYLLACLVLARFAGRSVVLSFARLLTDRFQSKSDRSPARPVYVSVRRRHFPDSPVEVYVSRASRREHETALPSTL